MQWEPQLSLDGFGDGRQPCYPKKTLDCFHSLCKVNSSTPCQYYDLLSMKLGTWHLQSESHEICEIFVDPLIECENFIKPLSWCNFFCKPPLHEYSI